MKTQPRSARPAWLFLWPPPWTAILCLGACTSASATDWPQWLGPLRNGTYLGTNLSPHFPAQGPAVLWKKPIGEGFSSPVVQSNKTIVFHRKDDQEFVECLQAETGDFLWSHSYPTRYVDSFGFDQGPRATPIIHEGRVYAFGAEGTLTCLDLNTGEPQWSIPTKSSFNAAQGFFGMACSPLLEGNALIIILGGANGAGITAFHKDTGELLWKATGQEASYASPVAATIRGSRYAFCFNREGLVALNPTNGFVYFQYPWRPAIHASVNAATPIVHNDEIFLSTSYGKGATLVRYQPSGPVTGWKGDDALSNHYATSVRHGDYLYGFHGRQEFGVELRCVEWKTGKVQWKEEGFKAGSILHDHQHLWILTEQGLLLSVEANPNAYRPVDRTQLLGFGTRAYPALAHGRIYARDKNQLVCADLQP